MTKARVYVETSVLSYLAARPSRDAVTAGRQIVTRQWWESKREKYKPVVPEAVEAECERGDPGVVERRRQLLVEVSLFPLDDEDTGTSEAASRSGQYSREGRT